MSEEIKNEKVVVEEKPEKKTTETAKSKGCERFKITATGGEEPIVTVDDIVLTFKPTDRGSLRAEFDNTETSDIFFKLYNVLGSHHRDCFEQALNEAGIDVHNTVLHSVAVEVYI